MSYAPWSESEIKKLIDLREWYRDQNVDWAKIAQHFPSRTTSQIKSFYFNRLKQFTFVDGERGEVLVDMNFVEASYLHALSDWIRPDETHYEKIQRAYCIKCYEDALSTIVLLGAAAAHGDKKQHEVVQNFAINKKLVVGMKYFIQCHELWHAEIDALLEHADEATFHGFHMQKEKWITMKKMFAETLTDQLRKSIDDIAAEMKMVIVRNNGKNDLQNQNE